MVWWSDNCNKSSSTVTTITLIFVKLTRDSQNFLGNTNTYCRFNLSVFDVSMNVVSVTTGNVSKYMIWQVQMLLEVRTSKSLFSARDSAVTESISSPAVPSRVDVTSR